MYIISTSKKTVLSEFKNLDTKSSYDHSNGESTDFQFFSRCGLFVEINVKSGLELMRVKEVNQTLQLQKVQKLGVDTLTSVACAKQSLEEIAMGMANGSIKIFNINSKENIHRFGMPGNRTGVSFMDYNFSDEYLCSVFENGSINLYGMKTKAKIESINIDGNSTLARFHPSKRSLLGIASYKGMATVYDTQAKKKIFHTVSGHSSPCRDLCFSKVCPYTLVTVGYDCVLKLFDTRRKTESYHTTCRYPLSSVSLSDCGNYICTGNLKGELSTYDSRNFKSALSVKKVHDSGIIRLGFVPNASDLFKNDSSSLLENPVAMESSSLENMPNSGSKATDYLKSIVMDKKSAMENTSTPSNSNKPARDSMLDFLDNLKKAGEKSCLTGHRESFDWSALGRRNSNLEVPGSMYQILSGLSSISSNQSTSVIGLDSTDSKISNNNDDEKAAPAKKTSTSGILRQSSTVSNISADFDVPAESKEIENTTSQENHPKNSNSGLLLNDFTNNNNSPALSHQHLLEVLQPEMKKQALEVFQEGIKKVIEDLRLELKKEFEQTRHQIELSENEVNYVAENNKWALLSQNSRLSIKHMEANNMIRENLEFLMQTDPFVNEFMRLKEENELLKKEIMSLKEK